MALFLPDANVLIQALRMGMPAHVGSRRWLVDAMAHGDDLGLCELVEVALLRIPTLPKLQLVPMADVLGFWGEDLWSYAGTRRLVPGARHKETLTRLVTDLKLVGNDLNDAWLAALAIEHRATLVSSDPGFGRFPGLAWLDPAV